MEMEIWHFCLFTEKSTCISEFSISSKLEWIFQSTCFMYNRDSKKVGMLSETYIKQNVIIYSRFIDQVSFHWTPSRFIFRIHFFPSTFSLQDFEHHLKMHGSSLRVSPEWGLCSWSGCTEFWHVGPGTCPTGGYPAGNITVTQPRTHTQIDHYKIHCALPCQTIITCVQSQTELKATVTLSQLYWL